MRRVRATALLLAVLAAVGLAVGALTSAGPGRTRDLPSADRGSRQPRADPAPSGAHPQAIEPQAGVAAGAAAGVTAGRVAGETPTPIGDPTAHAPPLSEVKRELKILNLCGGATSSAFAQPVVAASGAGFVPDPGTQQTEGQLPVLTARLDQLGKALGVTIYGISGYRTPAHSVAVGGFADDPHTRGEAEDIGVGSLLRVSAAQISEAELARFGLYRPFDPSDDPNNPEVNHIQLIPVGGPLSLAQATGTFSRDPRCR